MPGYWIRTLFVSFIVTSFLGTGSICAGDTESFLAQPTVSFVSEDEVPGTARQRSQLYGFRDGLTSRQSPPAVEYPAPPAPQRQVVTAELRTEQRDAGTVEIRPEIRQTAMAEPLPVVAASVPPPTAQVDSTPEEEAEESADDSVLGKTIGFSSKKSAKPGKLAKPEFADAIAPLISIIGSLLIVLSAFFILMMIFRKMSPKGNRLLPKEAFEDLGRTFLTPKLQLHLLRLGHRLILVSVTQDGVSPITEVTDPDEVVPLLGMCRQLDPNSSSERFRKIYSELSEKDYSETPKKTVAAKPQAKSSLVDLYSEPDESLADILASGLGTKGGRHG